MSYLYYYLLIVLDVLTLIKTMFPMFLLWQSFIRCTQSLSLSAYRKMTLAQSSMFYYSSSTNYFEVQRVSSNLSDNFSLCSTVIYIIHAKQFTLLFVQLYFFPTFASRFGGSMWNRKMERVIEQMGNRHSKQLHTQPEPKKHLQKSFKKLEKRFGGSKKFPTFAVPNETGA